MTNESPSRSAGHDRSWMAVFRAPEWGLVVGIAAVLAIIYFFDPSHAFFSEFSRRTLMHQVALFGVLSVGAAVVIIAGGIDLSIGAVVALASIVSAKLLTEWIGHPTASSPPSTMLVALVFAITLAMGLLVGLGHALMINWFRLPPFIATLATMAGLRSLATILSKNQPITVRFESYRLLGKEPSWTLIVFAIVAVVVSIVMGGTVIGRHLYALGGNEQAARLSGLPTRKLKIFAYGLSGVLAALGGILFTGRSGQADPRLGVTYELYAITAAVVGGCSLSGGVGSIRGTVLGLLLIQIVIKGTGFIVHGLDSTQVEGLVLGTVVVLAVAFNQRFRGRA
ncbi:ABC transporter permease [Singulisphaera sp. PoT]|uniref:ABC transporter permease n=1 Tax=Singulisphaera sp. PoT TaxID=3411797 RepID=UPI003BF515BB